MVPWVILVNLVVRHVYVPWRPLYKYLTTHHSLRRLKVSWGYFQICLDPFSFPFRISARNWSINLQNPISDMARDTGKWQKSALNGAKQTKVRSTEYRTQRNIKYPASNVPSARLSFLRTDILTTGYSRRKSLKWPSRTSNFLHCYLN